MVFLFSGARCFGLIKAFFSSKYKTTQPINLQLQNKPIMTGFVFATEEGPFGAEISCFIEQVYHVFHTQTFVSPVLHLL